MGEGYLDGIGVKYLWKLSKLGDDEIKNFIGYDDETVIGLYVDYQSGSCVRLGAASGKNAGKDFDSFPMYGGRRRCNVRNNGLITKYCGEDDYTEDGIDNEGQEVQVMVYQPIFWYRIVPLVLEKIAEPGIGYHIRKAIYYVSSTPKPGFKIHPAFYDKNGHVVDYILFSAYEGSFYDDSIKTYVKEIEDMSTYDVDYVNDKLSSISGCRPITNINRPNLEILAANRGDGWHADFIKAEAANQLLMIIEMAEIDLQNGIADGIVMINRSSIDTNRASFSGSTSYLENRTGRANSTMSYDGKIYTDVDKTAFSYRGMENPFGNIFKNIHGLNIIGDGHQNGGIPYVCVDLNFMDSGYSDNYKMVGFSFPNGFGYISAFGYGNEMYDWLFLPSEVDANMDNGIVKDYVNCGTNLSGRRFAIIGGYWGSSTYAGGFCYRLNYGQGYKNYDIGGRLVYVPEYEGYSWE